MEIRDETNKKISRRGRYSAETIKKMSASAKLRAPTMLGKHHSEETKKKMSQSQRGHKVSEEAKRNMSAARKGVPIGPRPRWIIERMKEANTGAKRSEESRKRMSLSHIGKASSRKGKKQSLEARQKQSAAQRGKKRGPRPAFSKEWRYKISLARARQIFPLQDTKIEKIIQYELSKRHIKFVKHKCFKFSNFIHQVDMFIEPNICIECDGDYWHSKLRHIRRDLLVNYTLESIGMKVLRFWEFDIKNNLQWCMDQIKKEMERLNVLVVSQGQSSV